jgi:hypothetical protein
MTQEERVQLQAKLAELESALHERRTGNTMVDGSYGEHRTRFAEVSTADIQAGIRAIKQLFGTGGRGQVF